MTFDANNPIGVFLTIPAGSPLAIPFAKFCGEFHAPEGQQKYLFLRCSSAVSEGGYLRVTLQMDPKPWTCRIPNQHVLLVTDVPDPEQKKFGFHS